jgi:hypothetical protein
MNIWSRDFSSTIDAVYDLCCSAAKGFARMGDYPVKFPVVLTGRDKNFAEKSKITVSSSRSG